MKISCNAYAERTEPLNDDRELAKRTSQGVLVYEEELWDSFLMHRRLTVAKTTPTTSHEFVPIMKFIVMLL
jgi:hypothetical protein